MRYTITVPPRQVEGLSTFEVDASTEEEALELVISGDMDPDSEELFGLDWDWDRASVYADEDDHEGFSAEEDLD